MYEVLIVEDDPMVAMINKQYVNQNDHFHVCAVCRDGKSAIEYLTNNIVHLIILDQYMPQMNGLQFLKKIREMDLPVSVIMVTAANDSSTIEDVLRFGIIDYLVKPFSNVRFQQALSTFISRQAAFHDLQSFKQHNIDALLENNLKHEKSSEMLPKGIQEQTLKKMCRFLKTHKDREFTSEAIADEVELSRVTVRRYMNHLLEKGMITGRMNYETGGRPCMLYRWMG